MKRALLAFMPAFMLPAILLLSACGNAPEDRANSTADAVLAADRAFAELAAREGAPYAFRQMLHPDAVLLPATEAPLRDADASHWLANLEDALEWTPEEAWGSASGDLGITRGRWTTRGIDAEGNPRVRRGNYVSVWRRDAEGEWKVLVDMRGEMEVQPGH